jgi:hypothetical protein
MTKKTPCSEPGLQITSVLPIRRQPGAMAPYWELSGSLTLGLPNPDGGELAAEN